MPFKIIIFMILMLLVWNGVSLHFHLTEKYDGILSSIDSIDISNDGNIFVIGSADDRAYVYNTSQGGTSSPQILTESVDNVRDVDLTGNGEWLAIADQNRSVIVYQSREGKFAVHQTIAITDDMSDLLAMSMTDDQWLVTGHGSGKVRVYSHDGTEFEFRDLLEASQSKVTSLALSHDHLMLVVASESDVAVYAFRDDRFQLNQTLEFGESWKRVTLTEDKQYLVISRQQDKQVSIFRN